MRAALVLALLVGGAGSAHSHDHWINYGGYTDPQHPTVHCCGEADCPVLSEDDVEPTAAGWHIKSLNETVPYGETYTSEDGKFYRCRRPVDNSRRCFFAPGQGS